ncbi:MAG TPA: pyridoxamine 5'-phosphate oxidase family protein [Sphingomicrobium sp.]|nr:pyridoxamine 5'-phosphate oxidase family protein [Sphingomicrobium sp.]
MSPSAGQGGSGVPHLTMLLEVAVQDSAIEILCSHRTMAISTLRADGWPQTTIVGYVNDGLTLYFLIFRSSQKLANIRRDKRISVAVGGETTELDQLTAVYAAAHAAEVRNPEERSRAWRLLQSRHPNLLDFELPERTEAAMIRATLQFVSILDYRKGAGFIEEREIGFEGATQPRSRKDEWGSATVKPGMVRPKEFPA